MAEFDPSFVVSGEQKIKTMIVKSCKYNKHGYLGVTATWITPNFEIKDVMLEINYVPSPHSSEVVANELYKCIKNWDLESRVISITTDNGSNMVSMFLLLNQKSGCENIQRLPCTAHTIQLAIGKGVSTRWNSSYYAWDRLFFLKDAII